MKIFNIPKLHKLYWKNEDTMIMWQAGIFWGLFFGLIIGYLIALIILTP